MMGLTFRRQIEADIRYAERVNDAAFRAEEVLGDLRAAGLLTDAQFDAAAAEIDRQMRAQIRAQVGPARAPLVLASFAFQTLRLQ